MEPFSFVEGRAVPLLVPDIDTDVITPIGRVTQGGDALVRYAFESLRYRPDGSLDPNCPLNKEVNQHAPILLTGANFACGSSRETAVWALLGLGIRCVIAPSFGDIFFDSCFENGLLPITLPQDVVERLAGEAADGVFRIDLERCEITSSSGRRLRFEMHPLHREALLSGRDSIDLTLKSDQTIAEFQRRDRELRPWVYALAEGAGGT